MARYGWRRALVNVGATRLRDLATVPRSGADAAGDGARDRLAAESDRVGLPRLVRSKLTMKQLIRMSPCELEQLYAQGIMAPIPAGKIRGQALLNPGTKLAVPTSRGSRLVWQGKIFNADGQTAVNRFFGVRMIKANVYNAESWRDGRPALILDYSQTSLLYAPYRDEIRQIAAGPLPRSDVRPQHLPREAQDVLRTRVRSRRVERHGLELFAPIYFAASRGAIVAAIWASLPTAPRPPKSSQRSVCSTDWPGIERDHRAEGLDLEHVLVGEGLEIDAVVGVELTFAILEPFDEERSAVEIAHTPQLMRQPELGRTARRDLAAG